MNTKYWCINNKEIPIWVQDLIDRQLLIHKGPTPISDCWIFKNSFLTTKPLYLYDGDGLILSNNKIGVVFSDYRNYQKLKKEIPMRRCYCDICGKEINYYLDDAEYNIEIGNKTNFSKQFHYDDVCEDCVNYIREKINERKQGKKI